MLNRFINNLLLIILLCLFNSVSLFAQSYTDYNLTWVTPSKTYSDAMPLGNGTTSALVSVVENGSLWINPRHVDAWSEGHRLLKLANVEFITTPNVFTKHYKQTFLLNEAAILLEGDYGFKGKVWVDANHEVIHFESTADKPISVEVKLHNWRKQAQEVNGINFSNAPTIMESADVILTASDNTLAWYHRNVSEQAYDITIKTLGVDPKKVPNNNVLANNTFGAMISGENAVKASKTSLMFKSQDKHHIKIFTSAKATTSGDDWYQTLQGTAAAYGQQALIQNWNAHLTNWQNFWQQSYIHLEGNEQVNKASATYNYIMMLNAITGKGRFPIMWNGSVFSPRTTNIPSHNHHGAKVNKDPDFRAWRNLMLHQNVRLPYYSMYAAGQFNFTKAFINLYKQGLPLMKAHTKAEFGHQGTVIRESITLWGVIAPGVYGIDRTGLKPGEQASIWHKTHWQSGLEVAYFMGDYYQYTLDENFAADTYLPFAKEIVTFFDLHWPHRNGKLYFPNMYAMETFRDTDNPMPIVAGLKALLQQMLTMPTQLTTEADRKYWLSLLAKVPAIPTRDYQGKTILANAEVVNSAKVNVEVSELYAVFPYRLYSVGQAELKMAQDTYENSTVRVNDVGGKNRDLPLRGGWRQEVLMATLLGLTDEAEKEVLWSLNRQVPGMRFPGFLQTTYDTVPDMQHASMAATALQSMIIQNVGDKIVLLPTWPKEWSGEFKLHAKKQTVVSGKIIQGKLTELVVSPESRKKDVVIGQQLMVPKADVWLN